MSIDYYNETKKEDTERMEMRMQLMEMALELIEERLKKCEKRMDTYCSRQKLLSQSVESLKKQKKK